MNIDFIIDAILGMLFKKVFPDKSPEEIKSLEDQIRPEIREIVEGGILKVQGNIMEKVVASTSKFVSYAYATLLWFCIGMFIFQDGIVPIINYACAIMGHPAPALPIFPVRDISALFVSILGIGGLHYLHNSSVIKDNK